MAEIKSIQRGTATIPATTLDVTASITAVTLTETMLVFGVAQVTDERPARDYVQGRINSTTQLTFRRQSALGTAITIEWYVVEWDSGVTVQSGTHFAEEDTTITAVVLADTFVWNTYFKGGNLQGADDGVKAWLSTTTNLRMEDNDTTLAGDVGAAWFVVESTDFDVQAGSLSMADGNTTADQTITEVTLAEAFPIISFSTDGTAVLNTFSLRGHFTSTTVLRVERDTDGSADPGTDGIRWQIVEVTDGSSVQSGTFVFSDTDGQESATVTAVTEGLPIAAGHQGRAGEGSASEDGVNSVEVTLDLTTSTNLQADRGTTSGTADIEWFLIDWNAAAAPADVYPPFPRHHHRRVRM